MYIIYNIYYRRRCPERTAIHLSCEPRENTLPGDPEDIPKYVQLVQSVSSCKDNWLKA